MTTEQRNFHFYAEIVIVTVLSLIAANFWNRSLNRTIDYYFGGNIPVDFIIAIIATIIAVFVLHFSFSSKVKKEAKQKPTHFTFFE